MWSSLEWTLGPEPRDREFKSRHSDFLVVEERHLAWSGTRRLWFRDPPTRPLPCRLTVSRLPVKEFIQVRILAGQL